MENKKRKELNKNKPRKDSCQNAHKDLQISKNMEIGRREVDYNQQKYQSHEGQQQVIQEEWNTQRRRNINQQVRFNTDRGVVQQQQVQTGIVSIPKKKYIH